MFQIINPAVIGGAIAAAVFFVRLDAIDEVLINVRAGMK